MGRFWFPKLKDGFPDGRELFEISVNSAKGCPKS